MTCDVLDWGVRPYRAAQAAMRELVRARIAGEKPDTLVLAEHPPVLTIGRQGSRANLLVSDSELQRRGIEILDVERGGDITYHGPGQLVLYPIVQLPAGRRNVKEFLHLLERAVVGVCRACGAPACAIAGLTGVWIGADDAGATRSEWRGEKKVASLGLAFKSWVSYHGVALNINCDLTPFTFINLCGLKGKQAINLNDATPQPVTMTHVKTMLVTTFHELWNNA
jgi:lipoate-protein ligase B